MMRMHLRLILIGLLLSVATPLYAQIARVNYTTCNDFTVGSPVASLSCAHTVSGTTFTDNFNRANTSAPHDIGAAWDVEQQPFAIVSNRIRATVIHTAASTEVYNAAVGLGPDHYTKATLATWSPTGGAHVVGYTGVRWNAATHTGYACEAHVNDFTGKTAVISKTVNGTYTPLTSSNAVTWAATDTLECRANGTTISLWRNGVQALSTTDSTIASGSPYLAIYSQTPALVTDVELDDFESGASAGSTPNSALTVGVLVRDPTAADAVMNTVTWNGVAMTKACEATYNDGSTVVGSSMWYLANPAAASANVVATPVGTVNQIAITTTLWSGVHQGQPKAACATNAGPEPTGGVMSTNIQTTGNGQMVVDALISTGEGTFSTSSSINTNTNPALGDGTFDGIASGYKLMTLGGINQMTWTAGAPSTLSRFAHSVLALAPATSTETLTWDESDATTSLFNVQWSHSANPAFTPLFSVPGGAGNFSAVNSYSGVNNRCYRVNAQNAIGFSPYSNLASAPGFQNTISPATQPNGTVGTPYAGTAISASGCVPPITFSATGLPPGVVLSSTGIWSGTPTAAGSYTIVVTARDSNLTPRTNAVSYPVTIAAAVAVTLSPSTQPAGQVGTSYAGVGTTVTASGGTGPYTFSATGLPPGVTISSGGVWGGIPTSPGTFTTVVSAVDSSATPITGNITYSIVINPAPVTNLSLSPASQPQGYVTVTYSGTTVTATGGVAPYTFTSSNRPPGLLLSAGGVWSGAPITAGTYATVVTATDSTGGTPKTGSITYNIVINPAPPPLSLSPATQPTGTVGVAYSGTTMSATGGSAPYTWSATGLPAGVTLSSSGVWGGTPTTAQTATTTVSVVDSTAGDIGTRTGSIVYSIVIDPAVPISLSPATQPPGVVGFAYSGTTVTATGGTGPYTFAQTGCPTGVALSAAGEWSGTPTVAGTFDCSVTATDSLAAEGNIHYTIGIQPVLTITPTVQPNGLVGTPYGGTGLTVTGGTAPYTFTATNLPNGVVLNSGGAWSGTPTTVQTVSTVVTVVDSSTPPGSENIIYPITITPAAATQPPFTLFWSYSGVDANGALELPTSWVIEQSTTPSGTFSQIAVVAAVTGGRLVTSYQVTNPPSPVGCWHVKAVDQAGNVSAPSAPYCRSNAGVTYGDVIAPSKPFSVTGN